MFPEAYAGNAQLRRMQRRIKARVVGQKSQQVELFEQPLDPFTRDDDQAMHLVPDQQSERIKQRRAGSDAHQPESGQLAHRQRLLGPTVDDRALRPGVGEDAQPTTVAHQHATRTMGLHRRGDLDDARRALEHMRGPQESNSARTNRECPQTLRGARL